MSLAEGRKYSLRFDEESEVIDVNVVDRSEQKISLNIFKNGEEICSAYSPKCTLNHSSKTPVLDIEETGIKVFTTMPLEFRELDERYLFSSDFKPSCEKIQDNGPSEDKYDILLYPAMQQSKKKDGNAT